MPIQAILSYLSEFVMTFRWDCGGKSKPARIQLRMVLLYTVGVSMTSTVFCGLARWDHRPEKPE